MELFATINKETEDYKLIADTQKLNMEFFITTGYVDSFRDWMSISYSDWDEFVDFEIDKKSKCKLYLKEELELPEWEKPVWREMGCENLLKQ